LQLGHIYPKLGAPLSEQVIIDLSQNPEELAAAKGDEYPLIFRLETISEKGLADGHVLEVHVQSQSKRAHMLNGSIICLQWGLANNVQAVTDFLPLLLMQPERSHAGGGSRCLINCQA